MRLMGGKGGRPIKIEILSSHIPSPPPAGHGFGIKFNKFPVKKIQGG